MDNSLRFTDVLSKAGTFNMAKNDLRSFEYSYKSEVTNVYPLTDNVNLYQIQICDPQQRKSFEFKPGQFIMLEVPGIGEAPFSISSSSVRHGDLEICIRRAGNLTDFLAGIKRGLIVSIRGPFGTDFPMQDMYGSNVLLIAGGLGIAPLRSPLAYVLENRNRYKDVHVIYGARTPSDLLFTYQYDMWRKFDINLHIIVEKADAAWSGPSGMITEALKPMCTVDGDCFADTYAVVCGPPIMFKFVCKMLTESGMPMQKMYVSLERRMHCGMGKCCRCNVGSTYTCLNGPVFDFWTVMNLKEAI